MASPTGSFRNAALKATATLVKGAAADLLGYHIFNLDAAIAYLQFYNAATAAAVTVGTTVPQLTIGVLASGVVDALNTYAIEPTGVGFTLGLVVAATTTPTGAVAPTTGLVTNVIFI